MSWTHKQRITVIAIVVLVATVPVLWQIGNVRTVQATEEKQADLANQTVPERQASNDYDGDGISDSTDQCPTRPETENGFQDSDGCPDVVETTGAS
ncbi:MAG: thrombospondin type 3 repeat-containing protein [Natronomonas sp.]